MSRTRSVYQQGVEKRHLKDSVLRYDHENGPHVVILVDPHGFLLGEWRITDVDRVQSVINLLNQCLRWYETLCM